MAAGSTTSIFISSSLVESSLCLPAAAAEGTASGAAEARVANAAGRFDEGERCVNNDNQGDPVGDDPPDVKQTTYLPASIGAEAAAAAAVRGGAAAAAAGAALALRAMPRQHEMLAGAMRRYDDDTAR
ncbi:hypothetical protein THAOC_37081 [Thalassiosira oceanica]|uniref:Uncharacterized protein n=1 Tax=Thalassiosira oceanica TaxID=159749 RepID=K0R6T5_THAOC|nr:hypothetical protein THAOC_37081 [Thalassiosira oceanica]|eukprot:EJK44381.1 hypothetical protein THAOC_37081 [Thalassiosira oceanica]